MIQVAIDSAPLTSGHKIRGVGAYTKEIINSLKTIKQKDFDIHSVNFEKADLSKYDLVHFPYFHPFQKTLVSKTSSNQKVVVTVHDLIQLIFPKVYKPGLKGKLNLIQQKKSLKKVDAIIVPSETSKKDVVRFLNIDPDKIHVVYEGVRNIFGKKPDTRLKEKIKAKYKLPDKFVLFVGDVNYNKNILNLIKACKEINIPLVICGKQAIEVSDAGINLMNLEGPRDYFRFLFNIPHPELGHYAELSDEFNKNNKIIIRTGFVPDEELAVIYSLATVYVQPSFYEGFGLPVLEAFASDLPVIVSKTNCLVEIAGDAALQADPHIPTKIGKTIKSLMSNHKLRLTLIKKGKERVKQYSWEKAGRETLGVYMKTLGL